MSTTIKKLTPAQNLINHYISKIKTDAEVLSKQGISSKTYNIKDFDCNLGLLITLLCTVHKIRKDTTLTTDTSITFTWE